MHRMETQLIPVISVCSLRFAIKEWQGESWTRSMAAPASGTTFLLFDDQDLRLAEQIVLNPAPVSSLNPPLCFAYHFLVFCAGGDVKVRAV